MSSAEIIAIGTELLLGDIVDTNTPFLAKELNKLGVDVFRTVIVGDNPVRIANQIRQSISNADIVVTTGGLGPTIDDPTRQAVADAFGLNLLFSESLWGQIKERFKRFNHTPTQNNRRQAYIPSGSSPIENTVGTAPAFFVKQSDKVVISLPGVPSEVKHIFSTKIIQILKELYSLNLTTITRVIHTAGIGESMLDNMIGEFEKLSNPTVGVMAKPGQVDIRITIKAKNEETARVMIKPIEDQILSLAGDYVFGFDDDTLIGSVKQIVKDSRNSLTLLHANTSISLQNQLEKLDIFDPMIEIDSEDFEKELLKRSLYNNPNENAILIFLEIYDSASLLFKMTFIHGSQIKTEENHFGGHSNLFNKWVVNHLLNSIRKHL